MIILEIGGAMDVNDLLATALRTVVIYVFVLIVVRLLGKRTIGNHRTFDLIVAFIIGEVVDEPIYGDVPVLQALVVIALVGGLHYLNSYLGYRSQRFDELTGGAPRVLIRRGEIDRKAMAAEHVNDEELESMLREQEIEDVKEVKQGTLETNGTLSVIKTDEARELQKSDLRRLTVER
jgi:uncharacterized membrane protein YcaP (DUF421 family)